MGANVRRSKKQSDASLSLQPEPLVFFIDRSLGRNIIPGALRRAGAEVRIHDEFFQPSAKDEVWLSEAGRQGWVVLTKDTRIRYRAVEINALLAAKVRAFVLTARGDLQGREIAAIFVKALPAIKRLANNTPPPFIAHVSRDGKVSIVRRSGGN